MSVLLIAIIIVIVIFAIIGYRNGLLGILFNIFSWIFVVLFVIIVNPYIYDYIVQNTSWQSSISSSARSFVDGEVERTVGSTDISNTPVGGGDVKPSEVNDTLSQYGITVPKEMLSDITSDVGNAISSTVNDASNSVTQVKNNVVNGIAETVSSYIIRGVACLIAFLIAKIICWIVYAIIKFAQDAPVVHGVTSFLGMIFGIIKGLFVTWVFFFLVSVTATTKFGQFFLPMITKSQILTFLYENNLVVWLFYYFF